jgi:5-methylcytosine-specific restriction endonuclease McrA
MRPYATVSPQFWTDQHGKRWKVSQTIGRLRCGQNPGHRALREYVIFRDGGKCKWCGATSDLIADHITSRRNGGSHHPDNLQCLCQSCNSRKVGLIDAKRRVAA